MDLEIYRSYTKYSQGIDRHDELCRKCAIDELEKGFEIEFDKHLSKYIETIDGVNYYYNDEINCSICDNNFIGVTDEDILR